MKMKQQIFNIINSDETNKWSKVFDFAIISLIVMSVSILFASTFQLPAKVDYWLNITETGIVITFSLEYLLRFWTATYAYPLQSSLKARLLYLKSGMSLIDLLSILPFYLPFLLPANLGGVRALRLVRLLRIFKLNRYTDAFTSIKNVVSEKAMQLLVSSAVVGVLMLVASLLIYSAEHEAQPEKFANAFAGLWWAVATLTTVGYGDIYPITVLGKILSAFIAILGIGMVAIPTGIISAGFMENLAHKEKDKFMFCPHCGKNLQ